LGFLPCFPRAGNWPKQEQDAKRRERTPKRVSNEFATILCPSQSLGASARSPWSQSRRRPFSIRTGLRVTSVYRAPFHRRRRKCSIEGRLSCRSRLSVPPYDVRRCRSAVGVADSCKSSSVPEHRRYTRSKHPEMRGFSRPSAAVSSPSG